MADEMAQQEYSDIKFYTSAFRYNNIDAVNALDWRGIKSQRILCYLRTLSYCFAAIIT